MQTRTRRQLIRAAAISAVSLPWLTARAADNDDNNGLHLGEKQSCFLKGTCIATPAGEREIQELCIGDEVTTLTSSQKIKWIAYNKFTKTNPRAWPDSVMPIRIAKRAINDMSPLRDLYVSAGHCIYCKFGELPMLIPVKYLVNDKTITAAAPPSAVLEYYHLEFDSHEVIFANGSPVESYGGYRRDSWSNFGQYQRLYGEQPELKPAAVVIKYHNRYQEIGGVVRSLMSTVVDMRDPIQIFHDELAERAERLRVMELS